MGMSSPTRAKNKGAEWLEQGEEEEDKRARDVGPGWSHQLEPIGPVACGHQYQLEAPTGTNDGPLIAVGGSNRD
jgi:hypothetical protein